MIYENVRYFIELIEKTYSETIVDIIVESEITLSTSMLRSINMRKDQLINNKSALKWLIADMLKRGIIIPKCIIRAFYLFISQQYVTKFVKDNVIGSSNIVFSEWEKPEEIFKDHEIIETILRSLYIFEVYVYNKIIPYTIYEIKRRNSLEFIKGVAKFKGLSDYGSIDVEPRTDEMEYSLDIDTINKIVVYNEDIIDEYDNLYIKIDRRGIISDIIFNGIIKSKEFSAEILSHMMKIINPALVRVEHRKEHKV